MISTSESLEEEIVSEFKKDFAEARKHRTAHLPNKNGKLLSLLAPTFKNETIAIMGRASAAYVFFVQAMGLFVLLLSAINFGWVYFHWTSPDDSHWNVHTEFNETSGTYVNSKITDSVSWAWRSSASNWSPYFRYEWQWLLLGLSRVAITLTFMIFFRVFRTWISKLLKNVQDRQLKSSDYSVYVTNLPHETRGTDLGLHFQSNYGTVKHVAVALNTAEVAVIKKRKKKLEAYARYLQARTNHSHTLGGIRGVIERALLGWYRFRLHSVMRNLTRTRNLLHEVTSPNHEYICCGSAFVTFMNESSKWRCLRDYNPAYLSCHRGPKFMGHRIRVSRAVEPKNVIWDHLQYSHISRLCRRSISVFFVALSMVIAFLVLLGLHWAHHWWEEFYHHYVYDNIHDTARSIEFLREHQDKVTVITNLLLVSFPFTVAHFIMHRILEHLLLAFAAFEKHKFHLSEDESIMWKVAISEVFTQSLIALLVSSIFSSYYNWTNWRVGYLQYDFYSILFWIIIAIAIVNVVYEALKRPLYWVKRQIQCFRALTQEELNNAMEPPEYHLGDRYGMQLKSIMTGLIFMTVWPPALLITCLTLFVSYWTEKHNLLRVYSRPSQSLDKIYVGATKVVSIAMIVWYFVDLVFQPLDLRFKDWETMGSNARGTIYYLVLWAISLLLFCVYVVLWNLFPFSREIRSLFVSPYAGWQKRLTTRNLSWDQANLQPYRPPVDQNSVKMKPVKTRRYF